MRQPEQQPVSTQASEDQTVRTSLVQQAWSSCSFDAVCRKLPETRRSVTHKFSVCGQEGYLIVGLNDDGRPGEVFVKMAKEGSTLGGLMDAIGILTSLALQSGVPVEKLAEKLSGARFEPAGQTGNAEIPEVSSLTDYLFQWLVKNFPTEPAKTAGQTDAASPRSR